MASEWTVEFYADEYGREPCREWMEDLSKPKRLALEEAIGLVLAERGLDVVKTEYGKALGQGLYEFRLRWTADEVRQKAGRVSASAAAKSEKIMLRVFFCTAGQKIILLLSGYDKGRAPGDRRQQKEIARARKIMTTYQEAERRAKRGADPMD
jgi:hypothetical protein